jgi:hypothetical protein
MTAIFPHEFEEETRKKIAYSCGSQHEEEQSKTHGAD